MASSRDGHCLPRPLALVLAALTLLPGSRALAQATGPLAGVVVAERENPEGWPRC